MRCREPLVKRYVAGLQNNIELDLKLLLALQACAEAGTGRLTLVLSEASAICIAALGANGAIRPPGSLKPFEGGFLIVALAAAPGLTVDGDQASHGPYGAVMVPSRRKMATPPFRAAPLKFLN